MTQPESPVPGGDQLYCLRGFLVWRSDDRCYPTHPSTTASATPSKPASPSVSPSKYSSPSPTASRATSPPSPLCPSTDPGLSITCVKRQTSHDDDCDDGGNPWSGPSCKRSDGGVCTNAFVFCAGGHAYDPQPVAAGTKCLDGEIVDATDPRCACGYDGGGVSPSHTPAPVPSISISKTPAPMPTHGYASASRSPGASPSNSPQASGGARQCCNGPVCCTAQCASTFFMCADGRTYPDQMTAPGTVCWDDGLGGYLIHANDPRCEPTPNACSAHETSVHCVRDAWGSGAWWNTDACTGQQYTCNDGAFYPTRRTDTGVLCHSGTGQLVCSTDDRCRLRDLPCVSADVQANGLPAFTSATAAGTVPIRLALANLLSTLLGTVFTVDQVAADPITPAMGGSGSSSSARRLKSAATIKRALESRHLVAEGAATGHHSHHRHDHHHGAVGSGEGINLAYFTLNQHLSASRFGRSLQAGSYNVYASPVSAAAIPAGPFSSGRDGWAPATAPLADVPVMDLNAVAGTAGIGATMLRIRVFLPADGSADESSAGGRRRLSTAAMISAITAALAPNATTGVSPLTAALSAAGMPYALAPLTAPVVVKPATKASGAPTSGSGATTGSGAGSVATGGDGDTPAAAAEGPPTASIAVGAAIGCVGLALALVAAGLIVRRRRAQAAAGKRGARAGRMGVVTMVSPTATQISVRGAAATAASAQVLQHPRLGRSATIGSAVLAIPGSGGLQAPPLAAYSAAAAGVDDVVFDNVMAIADAAVTAAALAKARSAAQGDAAATPETPVTAPGDKQAETPDLPNKIVGGRISLAVGPAAAAAKAQAAAGSRPLVASPLSKRGSRARLLTRSQTADSASADDVSNDSLPGAISAREGGIDAASALAAAVLASPVSHSRSGASGAPVATRQRASGASAAGIASRLAWASPKSSATAATGSAGGSTVNSRTAFTDDASSTSSGTASDAGGRSVASRSRAASIVSGMSSAAPSSAGASVLTAASGSMSEAASTASSDHTASSVVSGGVSDACSSVTGSSVLSGVSSATGSSSQSRLSRGSVMNARSASTAGGLSAAPSRRSRLFRVAEDDEEDENDDDAGPDCADEAARPTGAVPGRRSRGRDDSPSFDDVDEQSDGSGDERSAIVVTSSEGEEVDGASSLAESVAAAKRAASAPTSLAVDGGIITAQAASSVTKRNGGR